MPKYLLLCSTVQRFLTTWITWVLFFGEKGTELIILFYTTEDKVYSWIFHFKPEKPVWPNEPHQVWSDQYMYSFLAYEVHSFPWQAIYYQNNLHGYNT